MFSSALARMVMQKNLSKSKTHTGKRLWKPTSENECPIKCECHLELHFCDIVDT